MSVTELSGRGSHRQWLGDLRTAGPNSNILVRDSETNQRLKLLDPHGNLIKEYKLKGRRVFHEIGK